MTFSWQQDIVGPTTFTQIFLFLFSWRHWNFGFYCRTGTLEKSMRYWCADPFFPMLNSTHLVLLLPSTGPQQPHTRKPHLDFRLLLGLGRTCRQPQHQHASARVPPVTARRAAVPQKLSLALLGSVCAAAGQWWPHSPGTHPAPRRAMSATTTQRCAAQANWGFTGSCILIKSGCFSTKTQYSTSLTTGISQTNGKLLLQSMKMLSRTIVMFLLMWAAEWVSFLVCSLLMAEYNASIRHMWRLLWNTLLSSPQIDAVR